MITHTFTTTHPDTGASIEHTWKVDKILDLCASEEDLAKAAIRNIVIGAQAKVRPMLAKGTPREAIHHFLDHEFKYGLRVTAVAVPKTLDEDAAAEEAGIDESQIEWLRSKGYIR